MKEQSKEIKTSSFVFHMMSIILGGIVGDVFSTVRARGWKVPKNVKKD